MRHIITTNDTPDVDDAYAASVAALLTSSTRHGETTRNDTHGHLAFFLRLYAYQAPRTGAPRWAVDWEDDDSREVEEYDTAEEAQTRYLALAREAAASLGHDRDGAPERFTTTDIPSHLLYPPTPA